MTTSNPVGNHTQFLFDDSISVAQGFADRRPESYIVTRLRWWTFHFRDSFGNKKRAAKWKL